MKPSQVEVLLVEDNPNDAELTILALKEKKLLNQFVHLKNGAEAIDYIFATGTYSHRSAEDLPKVILLDINMPKIGGLEVLRILRADERTKMIPVVILTSSQHDRDIFEAYNLNVNSYIVKPVDFNKFMAAVAEIGLYWLLLNQPPVKIH